MVATNSPLPAPPQLTSDPALQSAPGQIQRLIVLVTQPDWDDADFPRRVRDSAAVQGSDVLLLGLFDHVGEASLLRRQLITMAAAIQDDHVSTRILIEAGNDWVGRVRGIWQPGDLVVCSADREAGSRHSPLSQLVASDLQVPVHVFYTSWPKSDGRRGLLRQVISWAGTLGIIAGLFWLQVVISQISGEATRAVLLSFSVLVEIGLILVWNSLWAS
jgi:hypothetical protein